MKLVIDGHEYEMDSDWLVQRWYEATAQYLNPDSAEAKKYSDLRLAAKAALRLRLGGILKAFAAIFHVEDWHELAPKRGEDMLVKLHQYVTILLRAEAQNLTLEMESSESHDTGIPGGESATRLALVRAGFAGGQTIYERPDAGTLKDATGQHTASRAIASGGRLVSDADASEVFERDTV